METNGGPKVGSIFRADSPSASSAYSYHRHSLYAAVSRDQLSDESWSITSGSTTLIVIKQAHDVFYGRLD